MPCVYFDEQGSLQYCMDDKPPSSVPEPTPQEVTVQTTQESAHPEPVMKQKSVKKKQKTNTTKLMDTQNTPPFAVDFFNFTCASKACDNSLPPRQFNCWPNGSNGSNEQQPHMQLPQKESAPPKEKPTEVSQSQPNVVPTLYTMLMGTLKGNEPPVDSSCPADTFNDVDLSGMDCDLLNIDAQQLYGFKGKTMAKLNKADKMHKIQENNQNQLAYHYSTKPSTQKVRTDIHIQVATKTPDVEIVIKCKICHEYVTTKSPYQLMLHLTVHEENAKRYGCPECLFKSTVSAGILNHVIRHHKLTKEHVVDRRGEELYNTWRNAILHCAPDYSESFEEYIASEAAISAGAKAGQHVKPCHPNLYRNKVTVNVPVPTVPFISMDSHGQIAPSDSQQPAYPLQYLQQSTTGPLRSSKKASKIAKDGNRKKRGPKANTLQKLYPYDYNPVDQQKQYQQWMIQGMYHNTNQNQSQSQ